MGGEAATAGFAALQLDDAGLNVDVAVYGCAPRGLDQTAAAAERLALAVAIMHRGQHDSQAGRPPIVTGCRSVLAVGCWQQTTRQPQSWAGLWSPLRAEWRGASIRWARSHRTEVEALDAADATDIRGNAFANTLAGRAALSGAPTEFGVRALAPAHITEIRNIRAVARMLAVWPQLDVCVRVARGCRGENGVLASSGSGGSLCV